MSIDPLATKYEYNSPYAFQENKMGMGRELEGLELVPHDNSMTVVKAEVANARLSNYNAPYRLGTSTGTYKTEVETTFSRVYTENGNADAQVDG
jgi:hypothetical protein